MGEGHVCGVLHTFVFSIGLKIFQIQSEKLERHQTSGHQASCKVVSQMEGKREPASEDT